MIALWVSDILQWILLLFFVGYAMANHLRINVNEGKTDEDNEWLAERLTKIENELKARGNGR